MFTVVVSQALVLGVTATSLGLKQPLNNFMNSRPLGRAATVSNHRPMSIVLLLGFVISLRRCYISPLSRSARGRIFVHGLGKAF